MPYNLEVEDVQQEAWTAVLEASAGGITNPAELQRLAELAIKRLLQRSARSALREIPLPALTAGADGDDIALESLDRLLRATPARRS